MACYRFKTISLNKLQRHDSESELSEITLEHSSRSQVRSLASLDASLALNGIFDNNRCNDNDNTEATAAALKSPNKEAIGMTTKVYEETPKKRATLGLSQEIKFDSPSSNTTELTTDSTFMDESLGSKTVMVKNVATATMKSADDVVNIDSKKSLELNLPTKVAKIDDNKEDKGESDDDGDFKDFLIEQVIAAKDNTNNKKDRGSENDGHDQNLDCKVQNNKQTMHESMPQLKTSRVQQRQRSQSPKPRNKKNCPGSKSLIQPAANIFTAHRSHSCGAIDDMLRGDNPINISNRGAYKSLCKERSFGVRKNQRRASSSRHSHKSSIIIADRSIHRDKVPINNRRSFHHKSHEEIQSTNTSSGNSRRNSHKVRSRHSYSSSNSNITTTRHSATKRRESERRVNSRRGDMRAKEREIGHTFEAVDKGKTTDSTTSSQRSSRTNKHSYGRIKRNSISTNRDNVTPKATNRRENRVTQQEPLMIGEPALHNRSMGDLGIDCNNNSPRTTISDCSLRRQYPRSRSMVHKSPHQMPSRSLVHRNSQTYKQIGFNGQTFDRTHHGMNRDSQHRRPSNISLQNSKRKESSNIDQTHHSRNGSPVFVGCFLKSDGKKVQKCLKRKEAIGKKTRYFNES